MTTKKEKKEVTMVKEETEPTTEIRVSGSVFPKLLPEDVNEEMDAKAKEEALATAAPLLQELEAAVSAIPDTNEFEEQAGETKYGVVPSETKELLEDAVLLLEDIRDALRERNTIAKKALREQVLANRIALRSEWASLSADRRANLITTLLEGSDT